MQEVMQKVREAVADRVVSFGTNTVFALMGATNQELICDLGDRLGVRIIHARHEAGAVGMADGYARFAARPGVATVTAGPGVTNTATSLAVARAHNSPVLLLAGDVPDRDLMNPQRFEQQGLTQLCAGDGGRLADPSELGEVLRSAADALTADRPFALHLPTDVQDMPAPPRYVGGRGTKAKAETAGPPVPEDEVEVEVEVEYEDEAEAEAEAEVDTCASMLAGARRPVILAGRGALGARGELAELGRALGAPLATTLRAAGLFAGNALEVGVAGPMGDGRAGHALAQADVVLAVGTSMHPLAASVLHERREPLDLIRINAGSAADGLTYLADLRIDAARGTRQLLEALARIERAVPATCWHHGEIRREWVDSGETTAGTVHPIDALAALGGLLPPSRPMVIGGGHAALGACQLLAATGPRDFTCVSTDFGAIGQALPVAIGACFARPNERVFHVTADGELMMALAELHTAIRYRLPLTIVVLNDHGFGQERHNLSRTGRPTRYASHPTPDLAALAEAMGAQGHRITHFRDLKVLEREPDHDEGVVLADIHIDPLYLNPASAHLAAAMASHGPAVRGNPA